jgi:hypothetical protein
VRCGVEFFTNSRAIRIKIRLAPRPICMAALPRQVFQQPVKALRVRPLKTSTSTKQKHRSKRGRANAVHGEVAKLQGVVTGYEGHAG